MKLQTGLMMSVACAALSMAATSARAADDQYAQLSQPRSTTVSELVVTGARERGLEAAVEPGPLGEKTVLDTPFSVTVIDAADIDARQPASMAQLFVNDPGVFSFATAGTVNWWGTQIRGLGVRNYYVDDVPMLLYWGGDYPLETVESVQALKGATGFLHGFGEPGGAISYRTKRPTAEPTLSTEIGWRGRSVLSAELDAGGPVGGNDTLGYRFTAAAADGEEYNEAQVRRGVASLALDYKVTPDLTWRSTLTYEDYRIEAEPFHIYWTLPAGSALPPVPSDYGNLHVDNSSYAYHTAIASTALDWRLSDDWSLSLSQGYSRKRHRSNKTFIEINNDAGDYTGYVYQFGEIDDYSYTQAMAHGEVVTGPVRHELVLGASHQGVKSSFGAAYTYSNDFNGNIFQRQTYVIPGTPYDGVDGSPFEERQDSLFVSDTLHFGEQWQAILGLRNTHYDLEDVDGDPTTESGYSTTAVTPTVAVLYKPAQKATLYASYAESLEGGAIVGPLYANAGDVLDAAVSKQYEVGAKYDGGRFDLTAAAFRIERVARIDTLVGTDRFLTQDGLTVYDGIEASGRYRVTDGLTLGLGAVVLDASYEKVSAGNEALLGTRPPETSKLQVVANAEYDVAAVEGLSLHGNVRYYGDATTFAANPPLAIPGYTLTNVGFRYRTRVGDRPVVITGNVNNLFDKQYWGMENFGEGVNGSLSLSTEW